MGRRRSAGRCARPPASLARDACRLASHTSRSPCTKCRRTSSAARRRLVMIAVMVRYVVVVIMMVLGVSAGLPACVPPPGLAIALNYGEVRGRLPSNGLRYVVMPDASTQLVEVDVRYEVGSREDPAGKAGLAHLAEHLMFQQRPDGTNGRSLMQLMRQLTLQVNAYTSEDTTHFMLNARADVIGMLIKLEALRMETGCKTISDEEFLREREVVRNEVRERRRSPEALIPQLTASAIYPAGHPYGHPIGGDDDQLSAITLRDACAFIASHYVP